MGGIFDGPIPPPPTWQEAAMQAFRNRAELAARRGFVGAFPNFYEATHGPDTVGGTIFVQRTTAEWRDVPLVDLGNVSLGDFGERMRATNTYASRNGFIGGFPNFFHADYGSGIVCGTILIRTDGAEWRDVPLQELGNPALDDLGLRFRATQDYAIRNGFVGGFPNLFHAEVSKPIIHLHEIVCGTILFKPGFAEWHDVVIFEGPS